MKSKIKLGDVVKDIYTGFRGTAISRTEWLHGCTRIGIEPTKLDKDGKVQEEQYFDEQRVELVKRQAVKVPKQTTTSDPGGPRPRPQRRRDA